MNGEENTINDNWFREDNLIIIPSGSTERNNSISFNVYSDELWVHKDMIDELARRNGKVEVLDKNLDTNIILNLYDNGEVELMIIENEEWEDDSFQKSRCYPITISEEEKRMLVGLVNDYFIEYKFIEKYYKKYLPPNFDHKKKILDTCVRKYLGDRILGEIALARSNSNAEYHTQEDLMKKYGFTNEDIESAEDLEIDYKSITDDIKIDG